MIKTWTNGVKFEDGAKEQVNNIASLPFIFKHVAIMPDVHKGIGATVGSVIPTVGALIPAAVGVDIGCGMIAQQTGLTANDLPNSLADLRADLEDTIPVGMAGWSSIPSHVSTVWKQLSKGFEDLCKKYPEFEKTNHINHLGTLGGGNHFIELCLDESDNVWIMLHSGSRGVGNRIGRTFIDKAKSQLGPRLKDLPDKDLAYLTEDTQFFMDYIDGLSWAQDFAYLNRQIMLLLVQKVLKNAFPGKITIVGNPFIHCHHNYAVKETHFGQHVWVTRKGAVKADKGDLGIIPGSMGAKSYIVRGKGNPDSFNSCSHGAGRVMSRTEAKKTFTESDMVLLTKGVECRKDFGVIDEIPAAYKDVEAVMRAQSDLVDIIHTLKGVLSVKG